ncbi:MAG TPA: SIS domain-containing protein [Verrucomicrobiota bacterium]|nr:hypothetical protein [Verrucomicrobiales bacterium]HRI15038.1 SIS domain-containing protein [Verrucomicrobiota bacterium]
MSAFDTYVSTIRDQFNQISHRQRLALEMAGDWVAEALARRRFLFVFGTGHSHMLAEELFYRAGGLARVIPILDEALMLHRSAVGSTAMERQEGYAAQVLERYSLTGGDVLIVASNSGRNAVPIELAQAARARGARVIAVTSLAQCRARASRHSSGLKLIDVADLVLDNLGVDGDAGLVVPGVTARVGPTSSLTGVFIMNLIVVSAIDRAVARGFVPEIFVSSNADGDAHNQRLLAELGSANPHF